MNEAHESTCSVSVHINKPLDEVFDFITTPGDWIKWHPATAYVSSDSCRPAEKGDVIVERVKHGPLRYTFRWEVVECDAPYRWMIMGVSNLLKRRVRITYDLSPYSGGTLWKREMCFYFPKPYAILDKLIVNKVLKKNSEKAVRQLKEYLEK